MLWRVRGKYPVATHTSRHSFHCCFVNVVAHLLMQLCSQCPFERALSLGDFMTLHEQSCLESVENRQAVARLNHDNAALTTEVDNLKSYIESAKMAMLAEQRCVVVVA